MWCLCSTRSIMDDRKMSLYNVSIRVRMMGLIQHSTDMFAISNKILRMDIYACVYDNYISESNVLHFRYVAGAGVNGTAIEKEELALLFNVKTSLIF